jgi:hypothetical protein
MEFTPLMPNDEDTLIREINRELPEEIWERYGALVARLREETITLEEQDELSGLSDQIEEAALRLQHLAKLSDLRGLPLNVMMKEFGIKPRQV